MTSRFNAWAAAVVFCAIAWSGVGVAGVKLTNIYADRGPDGFRHALITRVDHDFGRLKAVVTGVEHQA